MPPQTGTGPRCVISHAKDCAMSQSSWWNHFSILALFSLPLAAGALSLTGCSQSATGTSSEAHLSAEQLVVDLAKSYRSAKTYADSGELFLHFKYGGDKVVDERVDFSVTLARPNKLRLHCYQAVVVS